MCALDTPFLTYASDARYPTDMRDEPTRRSVLFTLSLLCLSIGIAAVTEGTRLPAPLTAAPAGTELPPYVFTERGSDGEPIDRGFVEMRGKPVMVVLWATWCGVCWKELPKLNDLQGHYGGRLQVVALSIDEAGIDAAASYLKERGLDHLRTYHDSARIHFAMLGAHGVPTVYLADDTGAILARADGVVDWDSPELRAYLDDFVGPVHSTRGP